MAESANIPVIDIASGRPEGEVAKELVDAAVEFGFIYIRCGGMDVKAIERAFELVSFASYPSSPVYTALVSSVWGVSESLFDYWIEGLVDMKGVGDGEAG